MEIRIVPTGTANLASVLGALARVGAPARVATNAAELDRAQALVLPGVGSFGAGLDGLERAGFAQPVTAWAREGRPLLAVCLGLQLLAGASEETPGRRGLGLWPVSVHAFGPGVLRPQLGWNLVRGGDLVADGYAYFANSYRLTDVPPGWRAAWCDHGGEFVAALERGPQLACQFHPELSGGWGHALLGRWLDRARSWARAGEADGGQEARAC